MTDRMNEQMNQPQIDLRANLFYLLQKLSGRAETSGRKPGVESPASDEQVETQQGQNGTVL